MSRSKRKTKIFGIAGTSEKQDKRKANRLFRKLTKSKLKTEEDPFLPTDLDEVSNVWSMAKDGKRWWNSATEKDMRK